MMVLGQFVTMARGLSDEFSLLVHRKVMRIHAGEHYGPPHGSICIRHWSAQTWPCEDFLRADRAIDAIINTRHQDS